MDELKKLKSIVTRERFMPARLPVRIAEAARPC
jgi:hypothetical protein